MKILLATYGTLKENERNHIFIKFQKGKLLGNERLEGYDLYDTSYGFPVAFKGNSQMLCEIYELDDKYAHIIDGLEGYKGNNNYESLYFKHKVKTVFGEAYIYLGNEIKFNNVLLDLVEEWEGKEEDKII